MELFWGYDQDYIQEEVRAYRCDFDEKDEVGGQRVTLSRNLFGKSEMGLIESSIVSTDAFGQQFGRKQAPGLDDVAFAVDPFGFNGVGVEPGCVEGQFFTSMLSITRL